MVTPKESKGGFIGQAHLRKDTDDLGVAQIALLAWQLQ